MSLIIHFNIDFINLLIIYCHEMTFLFFTDCFWRDFIGEDKFNVIARCFVCKLSLEINYWVIFKLNSFPQNGLNRFLWDLNLIIRIIMKLNLIPLEFDFLRSNDRAITLETKSSLSKFILLCTHLILVECEKYIEAFCIQLVAFRNSHRDSTGRSLRTWSCNFFGNSTILTFGRKF